jgi:hypothetical protein
MKRIGFVVSFLIVTAALSPAQDVKFAGNFYLAPQYWSKIGVSDDPKFGIGLGGMIGLGLVMDDMVLAVGPHFGYNMWSADYSEKKNSATKSVNINMEDVGAELSLVTGDVGVFLGTGSSKMEAYLMTTSDQRLDYPSNGKSYSYATVGFTFDSSPFAIGVAYVSYGGEAKDASRMEFRLGLGL